MKLDSLLLYFVTWLLVALAPGPAVICVMSQAARYGWSTGLQAVLGIQLGNLVFFLCIALGLAALLAAATNTFAVLQLAGAIYLIYLGLRIIVSAWRQRPADPSPSFRLGAGRNSPVFQALFVQLTNPKALLFVSALLPQFLDPDRPMASQLTMLLACTVLVDTAVLGSYAFAAHRGSRALRHSRLVKWLECAFGTALVIFGIRLLEWRR